MHNRIVSGMIAAGLAATAPVAMDAAAQGEVFRLEEVLVTARKRVESGQNVPISMTVMTGDELAKNRIISMRDIGLGNPNVSIPADQITTPPVIRGNIQSDPSTQLDASLATYLDDMIISRPMGFNASLYDLESMQTLKGPQGTLFGRNTTGGAMLFRVVDPSLEDGLTGYVDAEGGSSDTWGLEAAVNIPLWDDAALRVSGRHRETGEFLEYDDGTELGDAEWDGARAKFLWDVSEDTTIKFLYDYGQLEQTGATQTAVQPNDPQYDGPNYSATILNLFGGGGLVDTPHVQGDERQYGESDTYVLTVVHDIGDAELKFVAGHRELDVEFNQSLPPGTGVSAQDKPGLENTTFELQYNGTLFDDTLQVTSGLYYFDESTYEDQDTRMFDVMGGGTLATVEADTDIEAWSYYVQGTYAITDALNLTLGGRYTDDWRETKGDEFRLDSGLVEGVELEYDKEKFNYLVAVDYHFTDDVMGYASTSSGYRSGGANLIADKNNPGQWETFDLEEVINYELGMKSEWLDSSLRLNIAAFFQDYSDYQYNNIVAVGGLPTRVAGTTDADIYGGELEATYQFDFGLRFTFAYGLTDSEIQEGEFEGNEMPNIPKHNVSAIVDYVMDLGPGELQLNALWDWRDEMWSYTAFPDESTMEDKQVVNLAAIYSWDAWSVTGYVDNALDEEYYNSIVISEALDDLGTFGISTTYLSRPREYGVRVRYSF